MTDAPTGKSKTQQNYNPAPYVGTAIIHKELVLLGKRIEVCPRTNQKVSYGGWWSIFCGAVESNEAHYMAARREVFEETGFDLDKKKFIHIGLVGDLRLFVYELDKLAIPTLDYEHTEAGWFSIKHLQVSPSPTDEAIARKIQDYKNGVI